MSITFTVPDGRRVRFIHIPKTGGQWVRQLLKQMDKDGVISEFAFHPVSDHGTPSMYSVADVSFTVVRHPVPWYESYFRFQQSHDWKQWNPDQWHPFRLLTECGSNDFDEFVHKCIDREPSFVSRMYEWYIGPPDVYHVDYVCRQEKLAETVAKVLLDLVGRDFNVPSDFVVNMSIGPGIEWDEMARLAIEKLEAPAIRRFYGPGVSSSLLT